MGGGSGGGAAPTTPSCKISMLWNWYTVNSCFIARSWHNTSKGMFAGSCIGILLFVLLLELVRRAQREYDRYIVRQLSLASPACAPAASTSPRGSVAESDPKNPNPIVAIGEGLMGKKRQGPTAGQQAVRALIYMVQFGMAYFVMLLAMYYNGYVIICILVGAFLGHFLFGGDNLIVTGRQETGTSCC